MGSRAFAGSSSIPRCVDAGSARSLVSELIARAREQGFERLELETFSALGAAARIYRDAGFRVTWESERADWGRPIAYQHYRLELG